MGWLSGQFLQEKNPNNPTRKTRNLNKKPDEHPYFQYHSNIQNSIYVLLHIVGQHIHPHKPISEVIRALSRERYHYCDILRCL
ncbi:hypothetical protein Hanom_Chr07g00639841 [Helianthus anomalus]